MSRAKRLAMAPLLFCLVSSAAAAPDGDPAAGAAVYERCLACHSLDRNRTGPKHCGLIGRPAGALPDFPYSDAMRNSGLIWDPATLDRFLADPMGMLPGTRMGYAGISDAKARADLIAFLATAGANCP